MGTGQEIATPLREAATVTPEVVATVRNSVRRFAADVIGPVAGRPERPPVAKSVVAIVEAAEGIGLLDTDPAGVGLWSDLESPDRISLTLELLALLAEVSVGVALHLHELALGRSLCRRLGLTDALHPIPALGTGHALEHRGLALLLTGAAASEHDRAVLAETVSRAGGPHAWLLHAAEPWDALLVPVLDSVEPEPRLTWSLLSRRDLDVEVEQAVHGLAGTVAFNVAKSSDARPVATAPTEGTELLVQALGLRAVALLALGLGGLRHGISVARSYARQRVQGGALIATHPAVQQLLGEALGVHDTTTAALRAITTAPRNRVELAKLFGVRATLQPRLCDAANAALQVLGGSGYMRDVGVEQIVRDVNSLRVMGGTPSSLPMLVAQLTEVEA